MKNIWFTIYSSSKNHDKFLGLENYRTLLEILLIPAIQDKINRDKKVQKIMYCLIPEIDNDLIENFKNNYFNKRIVNGGIINLEISTMKLGWDSLSINEKKNFLIEKWKVLFNNLSDDYFLTNKSEVITSLEELKKEEWRITSPLIKKKLKYKGELFTITMDISIERAQLALIRDSDKKWFPLKDYEPSKIHTDANFKNFKLQEDTLTFSYKNIFNTMFESSAVFDLKEILK